MCSDVFVALGGSDIQISDPHRPQQETDSSFLAKTCRILRLTALWKKKRLRCIFKVKNITHTVIVNCIFMKEKLLYEQKEAMFIYFFSLAFA